MLLVVTFIKHFIITYAIEKEMYILDVEKTINLNFIF